MLLISILFASNSQAAEFPPGELVLQDCFFEEEFDPVALSPLLNTSASTPIDSWLLGTSDLDRALESVQGLSQGSGTGSVSTGDMGQVGGGSVGARLGTTSPSGAVDLGAPAVVTSTPMAKEGPVPTSQSDDWGATVYLSNDDSMSLASAQRVLFALTDNILLSPSKIRPHELLNYFSFDVAPLEGDELFSVLPTAEVSGETFSMALAIHGAKPPRQPLDLTVLVDRSGSMSAEGRAVG